MQFNPAKAFLSSLAQMWYVWLILGLVLIGRILFYFWEKQRLAKSGVGDIDKMDGKTFEKYLKGLFEKLGYRVERTRYMGDYGADLVATNNGVKTVIQAKRYKKEIGVRQR
jgi:restriction system protein